MFHTKVVVEIKTHVLCPVTFFPARKSRRLWDDVEKYGTAGQATDGNTVRRMRTACWISKATDTHSEYVTLHTIKPPNVLTLKITFLTHSLSYALWTFRNSLKKIKIDRKTSEL
jgi:hypothetical protein